MVCTDLEQGSVLMGLGLKAESSDLVWCRESSESDKWIEKLKQRYELTKKEKDLRALLNAQEKYDENIDDLSQEKSRIVITSMDYSLKKLIGE